MSLLVNIDVPDLAAGARFYTTAFDLHPVRKLGAEVLELSGWPAKVYLLQKPAESIGAGGDVRHYRRHWTPIHLDIVVSDLDCAVDRALRAGAQLESPAQTTAYGRTAVLADPFGHGFCLIAFNDQGYDALAL